MNDNQYCCNGECSQGRDCPRYAKQRMGWDEKLTLGIGLLGWVMFVFFVIGFFVGNWRLV